jgi:MFS superfamily sulfate permease-like transporter
MVVALQHFDLWSLRLVGGLRRGSLSSRYNVLAVVVAVAALSIALNIVLAVFIGVAIAIALFVLRMSRSVIRRTYRCSAIHSRTFAIWSRIGLLAKSSWREDRYDTRLYASEVRCDDSRRRGSLSNHSLCCRETEFSGRRQSGQNGFEGSGTP